MSVFSLNFIAQNNVCHFFDYMDMHRCFLLKNWLTIIFLSLSADTGLLAQDNVVREDTLGEVTVMSISAQRRLEEVQVAVEKIDIGTMAKVPSIFGERYILKNLQLLPGVKSEGEASSGYQVRGGTAAQNLILLDGATVYNAGHLMGRPEEVMDATDYQPPFNGK